MGRRRNRKSQETYLNLTRGMIWKIVPVRRPSNSATNRSAFVERSRRRVVQVYLQQVIAYVGGFSGKQNVHSVEKTASETIMVSAVGRETPLAQVSQSRTAVPRCTERCRSERSRGDVPSGVEGRCPERSRGAMSRAKSRGRAVCLRCCARLTSKKRRGIRGDTLSIFLQ